MKRKFVTPFKNPPPSRGTTSGSATSSDKKEAKKETNDREISNITTPLQQTSNASQDIKTGSSSQSSTNTTTKPKKFVPPTITKPLETKQPVVSKNITKSANSTTNDEEEGEVWMVMQTKNTNKKHKTFDDGILLIKNKRYTLFDSSGKQIVTKPVSVVE